MTVNYGEFVEFTCHFHFIDHLSHILQIYFGNSGHLIASYDGFNALDPHEYYVNISYNTNETIGIAGILINQKTIQVMEFFRCKLIHGAESVYSSPVYIVNINYPECAQISQGQTSSSYPMPSKTLSGYLTLLMTSTSMVPNLEPSTIELTHKNGTCHATIS